MNRVASASAAFTALAILAGCAAPLPPPYLFTGAEAAQLTLQNRSAGGVSLTAHEDGARCTGGAGIDAGIPDSQSRSLLPRGKSVTLAIPSGKEWAVHLVSDRVGELPRDGMAMSKQCSVIGSFVPGAGKRYRAVYDMQDGTCLFAVYAVSAKPDGTSTEQREPSERLRPTVLRNASTGGGICQ